MLRYCIAVALSVPLLSAADVRCAAYPAQQRSVHQARVRLDRLGEPLSFGRRPPLRARSSLGRAALTRGSGPARQRANFIDDLIFSKMETDGVEPAPLTSDTEFLRRVMLDLTGRIPTPEQVESFLNDQNANKRTALIDSLIGSEPFVDYWTKFFANQFQITSQYYNIIGTAGRNLFHNYLRDLVARDRPYSQVVEELISATGDSHQIGPPNFLMRGISRRSTST